MFRIPLPPMVPEAESRAPLHFADAEDSDVCLSPRTKETEGDVSVSFPAVIFSLQTFPDICGDEALPFMVRSVFTVPERPKFLAAGTSAAALAAFTEKMFAVRSSFGSVM